MMLSIKLLLQVKLTKAHRCKDNKLKQSRICLYEILWINKGEITIEELMLYYSKIEQNQIKHIKYWLKDLDENILYCSKNL
jgi:hypothetical protein